VSFRTVDSSGTLVVHLEDDTGGPGELLLFVVPAPGTEVGEALRGTIGQALRSQLSPRHIPDTIETVDVIPRTLTGKKLEAPVKRILLGAAPSDVASPDGLADPSALDAFAALASRRLPAGWKPR
jgi:acetoacetyl-CoA synthetase